MTENNSRGVIESQENVKFLSLYLSSVTAEKMVLKKFRKQILRNTVFYLFYLSGLIYTVYLIASNVQRYYKYSSQFIQSETVDYPGEVKKISRP